MMANVYLSKDLQENILSSLPVKSLLRFRCVSKSWCLLIDSPEFIKKHANRSETTESGMKLIATVFIPPHSRGPRYYSEGGAAAMPCYKFYAMDFESRTTFNKAQEVNYPGIMYVRDSIYIVGSCNGLLCLHSPVPPMKIVVWNPSTRSHLLLPDFPKQYKKFFDVVNNRRVHGFGYDHVRDDYKVVRFMKRLHRLELFICSLKSKQWRRLKGFSSGHVRIMQAEAVHSNGSLHWLLMDLSVLAFNLGTETFRLLPPPPDVPERLAKKMVIRVLGGHLHLVSTYIFGGVCDMWVMKNHGDGDRGDCWTKLTLDLSSSINFLHLMPFEFVKSHKHTCFFLTMTGQTVLYDLEKQLFKKARFLAPMHSFDACVYYESLLC